MHLDFECGSLAGWSTVGLPGPYSAVVQSGMARVGTKCCRFELRPDDWVSQGRRAELRDPFNAVLEEEVWYGFSTRLADDYPVAEGVSCVLAQWHDQAVKGDPSGKPPLALRFRDGVLRVTGAHADYATPEPATRYELARVPGIATGVWHDFVFRIHWSRFGPSEVRAWLNGEEMIDWRGPLGYRNQAEGPYFKLGVYCHDPIGQPYVAYHDNYSRGHSYADVDPAVLRSPA